MCAALCILPLLPVHKRCALGPLRVMIALVAVVLLVCASTYCAPPVLCNTVVVSPIHTNVENTTSPTGGRPRPTPYGSAREGQERESDTHAISNDIYELPAYNCHHQLCVLLAFADFFLLRFFLLSFITYSERKRHPKARKESQTTNCKTHPTTKTRANKRICIVRKKYKEVK